MRLACRILVWRLLWQLFILLLCRLQRFQAPYLACGTTFPVQFTQTFLLVLLAMIRLQRLILKTRLNLARLKKRKQKNRARPSRSIFNKPRLDRRKGFLNDSGIDGHQSRNFYFVWVIKLSGSSNRLGIQNVWVPKSPEDSKRLGIQIARGLKTSETRTSCRRLRPGML